VQRKSKAFHILCGAVLVLGLAHPSTAADEGSETKRLDKSIETLKQLVKAPDDGIPEYVLKRAEAIVVIPTLVKGGFIIGAEHGKGVMSVRDQTTQRWSVPSFVQITGGSIGWQIGAQSSDMVLLVMNKDGVDDLLTSEFKIGGEASVAAGPVGRSAEAATDGKFNSKILAYSRAKGLFAGLSLEGSALRDDEDANGDFYGREMKARQLFAMPPADVPVAARAWQEALASVASR
jgi:lipid-binding SYLF domain-containing protein